MASTSEYSISSDRSWVVVNDHAVMKLKNTIEIEMLENDKLPSDFKVQISYFTNHTDFKNKPEVIGKYKLKFHQPQKTGTDTVVYKVCNQTGECLEAIAVFRVVENQDKPNAARDVLATDHNTAIEADVFKNDYGNNSVTVAIIKDPEFGKYQANGTKIKYIPDNGFLGVDSLTYQLCDGKCSQNQMVIYVLGNNQPPVITDVNLTINEDEEFKFNIDVFKNGYSDPANVSLRRVKVVKLPEQGLLYYNAAEVKLLQEINTNNLDRLKYIPHPDYYGKDYLQWNASNGILYAEKLAGISFNILPVNDPPQANDDLVELQENQQVLIDVLVNDSDVDGDQLSLISINHPAGLGEFKIETGKVRYIPKLNYNGKFRFGYTISDGLKNSSASVDVTVKSVNTLPAITDFQIDMDENGQFVFTIETFKNSFSDQENASLHMIKITQLPAYGQLKLFGQPLKSPHEIIANDLDDLIYLPDKGFTGQDHLLWNASDGIDYAESPARLVINVLDINFPPVAVDDHGITTAEDVPVTIDVLANDYDDDGDELTISKLSSIATGELKITAENKVHYVPAENYNGSFNFQYEISDVAGKTAQGNVQVIVTEVNDVPVLQSFSIELILNSFYKFNAQQFLDHYTDVEEEEFSSLIIEQLPLHGSLKIRDVPVIKGQVISPFALGEMVYEPEKDYLGEDAFAWNASDGKTMAGRSAGVQISINYYSGQIHAYKAISPNGDGKNDEWIIEGIEMFPDNVLHIFDRNGNPLISIEKYDNKQKVWRGERDRLGAFNRVADGTYFYMLDLGEGIKTIKGYVIVQK